MSYDWFNRPESLQKAKNKYNNCDSKKKAAKTLSLKKML